MGTPIQNTFYFSASTWRSSNNRRGRAPKKHITSYYKNPFGPYGWETRIVDIPQGWQMSDINWTIHKKKVKGVFQMERHNKAPGYDDDEFPIEFYQTFWETIKGDMTAIFWDFLNGNLPLYSLYFGSVILLPKCREGNKIQ